LSEPCDAEQMRPASTPCEVFWCTSATAAGRRIPPIRTPGVDLFDFAAGRKFGTILADPPWRFANRTGKMALEHRRLSRYGTLSMEEISAIPVREVAAPMAHLYLWVPNALLPEGLRVMSAWGFEYKTNIVWHKLRRDGGSDGRGVGFYFRNVTELILFGTLGKNARTLAPGRRQVNYVGTRKREHSRKPDEQYSIIEACSPGPRIELFARGKRDDWCSWGNEAVEAYEPTWPTYDYNSAVERQALTARPNRAGDSSQGGPQSGYGVEGPVASST
jgi:N6-adenosine-specific RNA methylase IME4